MRSGGNDFNYFKVTKLANFVQFKRMLMFHLEDWGPGPHTLGYATCNVYASYRLTLQCLHY